MAIQNLNNRENDVVLFLNAVEDVLGTAPAQGSAIADLGQDISATYVEAEVQAISDKVDLILAALRAHGLIAT